MSDEQSRQLELEIRQLERDKTIEEIRQLKASGRTNWITPAALAALLPLLAGFGIWVVGEVKQYSEGYRALQDKKRIEAEYETLSRQKDSLNQEIVALLALKTHYAGQYKDLQDKVEVRQKQIDAAYLRARFNSEEARYALGHVDGMGPGPDRKALETLQQDIRALPEQSRTQLDQVIRRYDFALEIIKITQGILKPVDEALKLVPASDWAVKLTMMPTGAVISNRKIAVAPNDPATLYDVDEGRFLSKDEIGKLKVRR